MSDSMPLLCAPLFTWLYHLKTTIVLCFHTLLTEFLQYTRLPVYFSFIVKSFNFTIMVISHALRMRYLRLGWKMWLKSLLAVVLFNSAASYVVLSESFW